MRDEKVRRVFDRLSVLAERILAFLRHDAQRCWKLCTFTPFVRQLDILLVSERLRRFFCFEKTALSLPSFTVIHNEFKVGTVAVPVFTLANFASFHAPLLPHCCRKNK